MTIALPAKRYAPLCIYSILFAFFNLLPPVSSSSSGTPSILFIYKITFPFFRNRFALFIIEKNIFILIFFFFKFGDLLRWVVFFYHLIWGISFWVILSPGFQFLYKIEKIFSRTFLIFLFIILGSIIMVVIYLYWGLLFCVINMRALLVA